MGNYDKRPVNKFDESIIRRIFQDKATSEDLLVFKEFFVKVINTLPKHMKESLQLLFEGHPFLFSATLSEDLIDDLFSEFCLKILRRGKPLVKVYTVGYVRRMIRNFLTDLLNKKTLPSGASVKDNLLSVRPLREEEDEGVDEHLIDASTLEHQQVGELSTVLLNSFIERLNEALTPREKAEFCRQLRLKYRAFCESKKASVKKSSAEQKAFYRARRKFNEILSCDFPEIRLYFSTNDKEFVELLLQNLCGNIPKYFFRKRRPRGLKFRGDKELP